jgi:hypothetical protein
MRLYTRSHRHYCGIDLHARSMYVCVLNEAGEVLLHRNLACEPAVFLAAIAPCREDLVVGVECIFSWYWLADLCEREGLAGCSSTKMPEQRFTNGSHRRCTGIMGTSTRQRTALDWTPLSLHLGDRLHGTRKDLCPSPEPGQNWRSARRGHACTSLLSGTVRGNERVSRTWEREGSHTRRTPMPRAAAYPAAEPR